MSILSHFIENVAVLSVICIIVTAHIATKRDKTFSLNYITLCRHARKYFEEASRQIFLSRTEEYFSVPLSLSVAKVFVVAVGDMFFKTSLQ